MKPKLILGMLAVVAAVMGLLVLIPTKPGDEANPSLRPSPVNWTAVVDDTNRTLTISWMGIAAYPGAQDESWTQRRLEEVFHVSFQPYFFDWNAFGTRRPLMFCAGEIPDVIWDGDPLGVRENLRNGLIMEVPYEVILAHAPTYVKLMNRYGREAWLYSQYQGRNFGLPTFFEGANRPRIGCWRRDWLRKVGIDKVPETLAEMHEALRRFRYNDPDGDGREDTYGWSPDISHWSLAFAEVFAAEDVLGFDFMLRDGKVVWGGLLPGTKEALRVLRQWYAEGLLDPDFVLDARGTSSQEKFINGRTGYVYPVDSYQDYDGTIASSLAGKVHAFCKTAEIVPGPPLRDKAGRRRGRTWGGAGHILQFGRQLEQQPEKVLRVLDMIEAITRNENLYLDATCGQRGVQWDFDPQKGLYLLPPYDENSRLRSAQLLSPGGFGDVFFYPSSLSYTYGTKYTVPSAIHFGENCSNPAWGMMNVLGKSDVVPSAGRYLDDLRNYQMTFFVKIVTGERDLQDFDLFVKEWRRRGGDILTQEANAMYATMQQIWQRVGAAPPEVSP